MQKLSPATAQQTYYGPETETVEAPGMGARLREIEGYLDSAIETATLAISKIDGGLNQVASGKQASPRAVGLSEDINTLDCKMRELLMLNNMIAQRL